MAVTIGKMAAVLTLNAQSFSKKLQNVSKSTKKFARGFRALGIVGAAVGAGLAAAFTAATTGAIIFARSMKSTIAEMDKLGKSAELLRIPLNQFVALSLQANLAGIETKTLTMGVQRLARRIGEAAGGSKILSEAFANLGLNAQQLSQMPLIDALAHTADAVQNIADKTTEYHKVQKIFDSEGVVFLRFLRQGSEGMREHATLARDLGLTFANTFAGTTFAKANDAIAEMGKRLDGVRRMLAEQIAEAIVGIHGQFVVSGTAVDMLHGKISGLLESAIFGMGEVIGLGERLRNSLRHLGASFAAALRHRGTSPMAFGGPYAQVSGASLRATDEMFKQANFGNSNITGESAVAAFRAMQAKGREIIQEDIRQRNQSGDDHGNTRGLQNVVGTQTGGGVLSVGQ